MKTIYFVRHGECLANAQGRIAGASNDSPLTELGLKQADETAKTLQGTGVEVDSIISSPLSRAKDTALRIADRIGYDGEIRVEQILEERNFGSASGELKEIGFTKVDTGEIEDIESLEDFADRQRQVLELFKIIPGKYIIVVGHSGAEQMLRTIYEGRPHGTFLKTESLHNGMFREYEVD